MKYTVSCDLPDIQKVKSDEQIKFTATILEMCGLPNVGQLLPSDFDSSLFTLQMKKKLLEECEKFNLSIIDFTDGSMNIFVGENIIAKWNKSIIEYREDPSRTDRNKRLYAVVNFDFWSEFEDQNS